MSEEEKADALTICRVYFYDGGEVPFYSRDRRNPRNKNQPREEEVGLGRLEKMLLNTFKGKWKSAMMYENKQGGALKRKYVDGIRKI